MPPSELCPQGFNHVVEWPDHVHIDGQCFALLPVDVAEKTWAYLNSHVDVENGQYGYDVKGYNADIDALHSELDALKHGE